MLLPPETPTPETGGFGFYPGNYALLRGSLLQELRSIARPLKRGDLRGGLRAVPPAAANTWNHYVGRNGPVRFLCSCCGRPAHSFVHLGDHRGAMWNAACPGCDARSRHRGLALLIPRVLKGRPDLRRVLHFAPEGVLARIFLSTDGLEYRTTDLTEPHCDLPGEDIQNLSFADGDYDLVLCNQVLEHVPDDGAGMREVFRILSSHGLALITVPCDWRQAETETFAHVRPGGHYRHYGCDLAERLRQVFQSVEVFDMHRLDAAPNGLSYGIPEYDMVFVCSKGGPAGLPGTSESRSWTEGVDAKD